MKFYSEKKQIKFTPAMEEHLINKLSKLEKFIDNLDGKTTLKKEGHLLKLEISLPGNIRASDYGEDYYSLVIKVVDVLERQVKKYKTLRSRHRNTGKLAVNITDYEPILYEELPDISGDIVKEKFISLETITKWEAIEKMELLGHSFFIFKDGFDGGTSVVYKRNDGDYGILIMPN